MEPQAPRRERLRILCLHGFRTNSKVMENQTRGLQEALGDAAEFIYWNAPFEAQGESDASIRKHHAHDAPFYEWYDVRRHPLDDTEDAEWPYRYVGLEEAMQSVEERLQTLGPVDVVMGFSQGAVLLTIMTMFYHHNGTKPRWKLCICVCGVRVRDFTCRDLFTNDQKPIFIPFPSIHVVGTNDPFHDESMQLANMYDPTQRLVFEHDGGHKFPSVRRYQSFYTTLAHVLQQFCHQASRPSFAACRL